MSDAPRYIAGTPERKVVYAWEGEVAALKAEIEQMTAALQAVDVLWSRDAGMGFQQEMSPPSPVGLVWSQVKIALSHQQPASSSLTKDSK